MRFLTLSWGDGFRRSTWRAAETFEQFGAQAELNVLAALGRHTHGDFVLWNEPQAGEHAVQLRGYQRASRSKLSLPKAHCLMLRCPRFFRAPAGSNNSLIARATAA